MKWLPVMTLPDGTTIEMAMPTSDDEDLRGGHAYRVRGVDGIIELGALSELADYILEQGPHSPQNPAETLGTQ